MRVDFRVTGLGDAWMRMMALCTLSRIRPGGRHVVYPPSLIVPLARSLFGDFFDVETGGPADIEMRHHGLRHLLPGMFAGKRYYSPFYWILRETRTRTTIKDKLNDVGYFVAAATTRLLLPSRQYAFEYQGFMEMQGLPPFRGVTLEEFECESQTDLKKLHERVLKRFGGRIHKSRTVVFPSGSAHQIMPPKTAAKMLPNADFAFYEKDELLWDYEREGLNIIKFGKPPEEICALISDASTVFCTDSFPSHLAQMWPDRTIPLMTEMRRSMTVHPGFPTSRVIQSQAECHPCRNLARLGPDHRCQAGRVFCSTWDSSEYLAQLSTVNSYTLPRDGGPQLAITE